MWRCNLSFSHLKVGVWSCNRENLNKIWFSAHLIVPLQRKDTIMAIQTLYSAKQIEQQFHTGEEPVMVMCSDVNIYVCKYMRSSATAYKLACEFIGTKLANAWQLNTPDFVLVNIRSRNSHPRIPFYGQTCFVISDNVQTVGLASSLPTV